MKLRLAQVKWSLLFGLALFSTCSAAQWGICPVNGEVQAIYWKPYGSGMVAGLFQISSIDSPREEVISVRPDYDWGVRIRASGQLPCCLRAMVDYTYLHSTGRYDVQLEIGQGFSPVGGITSVFGSGEVESHADFNYHAVDVLLLKDVCSSMCSQFALYGGGRYAYLGYALSTALTESNGNEAFEDFRTRFSGAGPVIGLGVAHCLGRCVWLRARSDVSGLIGDNRRRGFNEGDGQHRLVKHSATIFVPTLGGEVDLGCCFSCRCVEACVFVGYAYRSFFREGDLVNYAFESAVQLGNLRTVSVGGPYAGVQATF